MDCPFCGDKDVQARMIVKDDLVMSFPTYIPITPGHLLVCPTRHVSKIDELTDEELVAIKKLIVRLKGALKKTLDVEGFNMAWNEGQVAGQSVNHLHFHLVPRKSGDSGVDQYEPRKFLYWPGPRTKSPEQDLINVADLIRGNI